MKFAAVIEYTQDKEKIAAIRPTHRAYLTKLLEDGKLVASGPFEDDYGALIVYEAADMAGAEAILKADPFHDGGIFIRWTIRPWKLLFANPQLMPPKL